MHLPKPVNESILGLFRELTGNSISSVSCRSITGGSINEAALVSSGETRLFIKWNDAHSYPGMFEAEARGLNLLKDPGGALVPEVIGTGEADSLSWLALEYIERSSLAGKGAENFGEMLADLHRNSSHGFGLDHNNYMGSLVQSNSLHQSWSEFFILERIAPQLKISVNSGRLNSTDSKRFEEIFKLLPELIPEEPPALIHGDLWSGNYIPGKDDKTWLIDPAVTYGHRETDIAMSRLFGGFPPGFYNSYNHKYPLEKGWESRIEIFQLYPLLIHVNLFSGGYISSVRSIIKRYS